MNDSERPVWETVRSPDYYLKVMDNMRNLRGDRSVRFGTGGNGERPNYQVEYPDGRKVPYFSSNHQINREVDAYDPEHLSRSYSFLEVRELMKSCLESRPRG